MRRPGTRPLLAPVLLGGLLLSGPALAGCSLLDRGPSAEDGAKELARGFATGKLSTLGFSGGTPQQAQAQWDRTVAGMGSSRPTVTVQDVEEGKDGAASTARLSWSWTLAGSPEPWTYETTARLTEADGGSRWRTSLTPDLVAPGLEQGERLRRTTTFADRADVLGAGGARLVTERAVLRFGIDKSQVGKDRQAASARELAGALDVDAKAFVAKVRAAGEKAFVEAVVLRRADGQAVLRSGATDIPGAAVLRDTLPLAPTREFARAVLGTVGPVSAEIVKRSKGVYGVGDEAGLSGLESRYDEQLRGTPGVTVQAVDAKGTARDLFTDEPTPGKDLQTTLDPTLQRAAERSLSGVTSASAVVALRPSTGDLLAVANGTGSKGLPTATTGQYAPGSTFKVVSSLALLRSVVRPTTPVSCPATTVVDGKRFKNYDDYPAGALGRIPFSRAVANSCNTAFVNERGEASQKALADAAAALGVGVDHDLGFPAYFGSVPDSAAAAGSETGHAASMIGQGKVVVSPMAMATVAGSVAKGSTVVPRLLPQQEAEAADPSVPLTSTEAKQLRSLMRGVVTEGSGALLADVPGPPVLAKTGTAEFGESEPLQTHAWMIAAQGDLAVAVFVDVGDSGSGTAGPVLESFLRAAR